MYLIYPLCTSFSHIRVDPTCISHTWNASYKSRVVYGNSTQMKPNLYVVHHIEHIGIGGLFKGQLNTKIQPKFSLHLDFIIAQIKPHDKYVTN